MKKDFGGNDHSFPRFYSNGWVSMPFMALLSANNGQ
jgi:hypothetical protein